MLGEHTVPGGPCILITSPVPTIRFPGCTVRAPSQVCPVSLWGVDLRLRPSWQISTIQDPRKTWLATGSLYPKDQWCHPLLPVQPPSLVMDASIWASSLLAVAFRWWWWFFFFFSSLLCYPLSFQNSPQTCLWEVFLLFGNFSTTTSQDRSPIPNSFVSLFVFYILSYLLSKRMGCLSGGLMSSATIWKLFCGSCSAFKWFFDEFVGEKVVSHPIPLPPECFLFDPFVLLW